MIGQVAYRRLSGLIVVQVEETSLPWVDLADPVECAAAAGRFPLAALGLATVRAETAVAPLTAETYAAVFWGQPREDARAEPPIHEGRRYQRGERLALLGGARLFDTIGYRPEDADDLVDLVDTTLDDLSSLPETDEPEL